MIVVSDTSPIIYLATIGKLNLLKALFDRVIIPDSVFHELTVRGNGLPGSSEVLNADWIEVRSCKNLTLLKSLEMQLDIGEAQAIAIACEIPADLLIIDERAGRTIAKNMEIPIIGLLGIFKIAKNKGLLKKVKPVIDQIIFEAGFRVNPELYRTFLISVNEKASD